MSSLISLSDFDQAGVQKLIAGAAAWRPGNGMPILAGRIVGLYFHQPSTRTRTSFASAALRLGANVITYGPADLQLATGESPEDTGEVLASLIDALVVRASCDNAHLERFSQNGLAVINAMNSVEHPTQAISDLVTMRQERGQLEGVDVLYVGEANSTTLALANGLMRIPMAQLTIASPAGYGLDEAALSSLEMSGARTGAVCTQVSQVDSVLHAPDFVYTTQWETTGTIKSDHNWRSAFYPDFQVNEAMVERWPQAMFMHDLPARRGEEVSAGVLDGPRCLAKTQAGNKLNAAVAALVWALLGPDGLDRLEGC